MTENCVRTENYKGKQEIVRKYRELQKGPGIVGEQRIVEDTGNCVRE